MSEKIYDEPIDVTASIDPEGQIAPQRFTWQGKAHTVAHVGRQWTSEEGRHVMVMTGDGSRFELQLSRQSLVWYLRRVWQAEILA